VRLLEQVGVPLDRMICVAGGERIELGHDVFVSVYPSQHSCTWTGTHGAESETRVSGISVSPGRSALPA
jgi:hypothetical protein